MLLQDPPEFKATGEAKFTLDPRVSAARVLGKESRVHKK